MRETERDFWTETKTSMLAVVIAACLVVPALYFKSTIPEQWEPIASVIRIVGPVSVILMFVTGKWKPGNPLAILILVFLWYIPWSFYIASRILHRNVQRQDT